MSSPVNKLKFNYHVVKRALRIMPRKSKRIKMLYVEYVNSLANGNERVIKFRFTNALWFKVGSRNTINTRVPLELETEKELELTVYGLFRKSTYTLMLKQDYIQVVSIH